MSVREKKAALAERAQSPQSRSAFLGRRDLARVELEHRDARVQAHTFAESSRQTTLVCHAWRSTAWPPILDFLSTFCPPFVHALVAGGRARRQLELHDLVAEVRVGPRLGGDGHFAGWNLIVLGSLD